MINWRRDLNVVGVPERAWICVGEKMATVSKYARKFKRESIDDKPHAYYNSLTKLGLSAK